MHIEMCIFQRCCMALTSIRNRKREREREFVCTNYNSISNNLVWISHGVVQHNNTINKVYYIFTIDWTEWMSECMSEWMRAKTLALKHTDMVRMLSYTHKHIIRIWQRQNNNESKECDFNRILWKKNKHKKS